MGSKRLIFERVSILAIYCLGFLISCKENKSNVDENYQELDSLKNNATSLDQTKILDIKLNDTVFQNVQIKGGIKYDMTVDTLDISDISYRHIIFIASTHNNISTFKQIKKYASDADVVDSIVTNGIHTFNFEVIFKSLGRDTLRIGIEDLIIPRGDTTKETVNIRKQHTILPLPLYVLDSSLIVGYRGDTIYFEAEKEVIMKRKDSAKFVDENRRKSDSIKKVLNNQ